MIVTIPRSPSTRTRSPVLIRAVACPVPTTAGMPYSRATIAACDMVPPMSETAPAILPKTGPQLGAVTGRIRELKSRVQRVNPVANRDDYLTLAGELFSLEQHARALREQAVGGL